MTTKRKKASKKSSNKLFKRKKAVPGSEKRVERGYKDLECSECGRNVLVDIKTETVLCSQCTQRGCGAPDMPKRITEEDKAERSERRRVRKEAIARGEKPPSDGRGKTSRLTGQYLYRKRKTNPRRPGSHSHAMWEKMKDGMTYEDYLAMGGKPVDLLYEIKNGRIEARGEKKKVTRPKKKATSKKRSKKR